MSLDHAVKKTRVTDGTDDLLITASGEALVVVNSALPSGTNNIGDVDILTVPAPLSTTGGGTEAAALRVTIASDSTGVVSVDDNGASLTVDGTVAVSNISAYTEDAVSAADPVGQAVILVRQDTPATVTNLNGDNVAQRATNYGAGYVQVLTSAGAFVDSFGGGAQYTEDVASAADPVGNQLITRRRDALAAETNLDGDNVALNATNKGELYVKQTDVVPVSDNAGSLTVDAPVGTPVFVRLSDGAAAIATLPVSAASLPLPTGASTLAEQQTQTTALQLIDDAVYASDGVLNKSMAMGAVFDDVATVAITENQAGYVRMSSRRALLVEGVAGGTAQPVSAASLPLPTGAATLAGQTQPGIDIGDVTINNAAGASAVNIQDGGNSITVDGTVAVSGTVTVDSEMPAAAALADATVNPTTTLIASANEVFNGTTWDRMRGTTTGVQTIGGLAHDAVNSAANLPAVQGREAIAHGANPTAVAAGDVTKQYANRAGIPFMIGGHPNIITREVTVLAADGAQTNAAFVSVAAGLKIVVTRISVLAHKSNSVSVGVRVGFGAASLAAASLAGTNGILMAHPFIAAGSGVVEGNGSGILGIGADDEDIRYTCDSPTAGSIKILCSYYTIES